MVGWFDYAAADFDADLAGEQYDVDEADFVQFFKNPPGFVTETCR